MLSILIVIDCVLVVLVLYRLVLFVIWLISVMEWLSVWVIVFWLLVLIVVLSRVN